MCTGQEVADQNTELTRVQQAISPLHTSAERLLGELRRTREEVEIGRRERDLARLSASNLELLKKRLTQLHSDLEVRPTHLQMHAL